MPRFSTTTTALAAAMTLFAAPALAQVYTAESQAEYEACKKKDTQNQIIGGVVGGVLGGFLGDKIEKGEGTVIGGAAGAYAGTRVANKDCEALLVRDDFADYGTGYETQTTTVVTTEPRSEVAGAVTYAPTGMVRVEDDNGRVFYVSQADYDRYYR
ncbi:MAG: glycine zipper 2TM domain-containing protein [Litorimonas sp.]